MAKLDWRKAKLEGKRSLSVPDEEERMERDAASRWLDKANTLRRTESCKRTKPRRKKERKKAQKKGECYDDRSQ